MLVEELAQAGVPAMGYNDNFSIKMLGGTLLRWGTEEQKRRFLPRILSGEDLWCQGFSEPGAGSDLASLSHPCRARRRPLGDQRPEAVDLAGPARRTGSSCWPAPTRRRPSTGASRFLLVELDQPGIEVRPIRALSGESEFNEVFFDGARTPADHVVGDVDGGWAVATTLLGLERGEEAATNPILFRAELDRLVAMAARARAAATTRSSANGSPQAYARCEIMRFLGLRILTGCPARRRRSGPSPRSPSCTGASTTSASPPRPRCPGADALTVEGRGPLRSWRADDPGAPNTSGSWLGAFCNADRRHDLRRRRRRSREHSRRVGAGAAPLRRGYSSVPTSSAKRCSSSITRPPSPQTIRSQSCTPRSA